MTVFLSTGLHADFSLTFQENIIANKWAEAASSAVDSAKKGKAVDAAATAGALAKEVANSAATAATFGFYAGVTVEHDKDITTSGTKSIVHKGSTLTSAGGMDLGVTGADFEMTGGNITNSGGDLRLIGDKVTLLGSTDTQTSTFDNAHENQNLDLQTNIVGYYNATATAAQSGAKQAASTNQVHNLMITNTGTTKYETEDLTIKGVDSSAKVQDVSAVKRLTLETLQDTNNSENSNYNWSVSGSMGSGGSSVGGSVGEGHGNANSKTTKSITKLTATEDIIGSLDTLNMKGAQLAVVKEDGTQGAAHLSAKTINLENLENYDKANQDSFGFGITGNLGGATGAQRDATAQTAKTGQPSVGGGSFSIGQSGHTKEGYTQNIVGPGITADTTLGSGTQTIDATKATIITKDDVRQGITLVVENTKMLTDEADLISSGGDVKKVIDNKDGYVGGKINDIGGLAQTGKAAERVGRAAGDLTDSTIKGLTGDQGVKDQGGIFGDYMNKTNLREASLQFAKFNPELAKDLAGSDIAKRDAATQKFNEYASEQFGVKGPSGTASYNGKDLKDTKKDVAINAETNEPVKKSNLDALYDTENKTIAINDAKQDGSTTKYTKTNGHELDHHIDKQLGKTTTESGADRFGDQMADALAGEIGSGQSANIDRLSLDHPVNMTKAPEYEIGNTLASNADEVDPKVYMYRTSTPLEKLTTNQGYVDHVVASDGLDDKKVQWVSKERATNLKVLAELQGREIAEVKPGMKGIGKEYDLNKEGDFKTLQGMTDITYKGGLELDYYYMSGIQNTPESAAVGAQMMERDLEIPMGVINNKTAGEGSLYGIGKDVVEVGNGHTLKDVVAAKVLEDLSNNGRESTVIMFSAANTDVKKAAEVMALEGRTLGGNVHFVSVGSPESERSLDKALTKVDGVLDKQFNNPLDPVTHPKTMAVGTVVAAAGAAYLTYVGAGLVLGMVDTAITGVVGGVITKASTSVVEMAKAGATSGPTPTALGRFADLAVQVGGKVVQVGGTAVAGGGTLYMGGKKINENIKLYHSYDSYYNSDKTGLRTYLKEKVNATK